MGKAPESSRVLKNIGAIFPPKQKPPSFLLGIKGISSPICHKTELVADFLEDPVPTTSPTKTRGFPFAFCLSISFNGSCKPVLGILNIARACRGISGLDQASGAGDKSSVFISPVTLKTVSLICSGNGVLSVNHVPSAQALITCSAYLFSFDNSKISLNASKINKVSLSDFAATSPSSSIFKHSIRG